MQSLPVKQRNFFLFSRWLCLNNWIGEEKMFCLVDKIPAFEDCPFFAKVAFSVEKKQRIEGKSCFCVLCNRAILPSLIINPRLTFCQEKNVHNTYEEKNHLD